MSQVSLTFSEFIDDEFDWHGEESAGCEPRSEECTDGEIIAEKSDGDGDKTGSGNIDETISVDAQCAVDDDKITIEHPTEGDEHVADPVKPTQIPRPEKRHRDVSLPDGIDLDNLISAPNPRLSLTPPDLNATASSHNLRHRTQSKLVYDVKYHPMDDSLRPSQAAKRRSAHREETVFDSDDSNEACSFDLSADESSDEHDEIHVQPCKKTTKSKKKILVQTQLTPREGTRRSARKVAEPKTSYNMEVHPQDKFLVISSDDDEEREPTKKRRKLTHAPIKVDSDSDDGVAELNADGEKGQYINSDESDSDEEPPLASSDENRNQNDTTVNTSSPASSTNPPRDSGIRRREGMDVWHLPPGTRYFRHDRDSWPIQPGQPFKIFYEKLEDQLAREALAASPLAYPHDDKENAKNVADVDLECDGNDGVSVIPAELYRKSSQDRELERHRDHMNNVLYDDDLSLGYGLDGAHAANRESDDAFSEAMCVLASGGHLPSGQEQAKAEKKECGLARDGKGGAGDVDVDSVFGSSFSCSE